MTWEEGQNPNSLLALLGKRAIADTNDFNEIAKRLETLRREGYCTHWEMKILPNDDKKNPAILKVILERKRKDG